MHALVVAVATLQLAFTQAQAPAPVGPPTSPRVAAPAAIGSAESGPRLLVRFRSSPVTPAGLAADTPVTPRLAADTPVTPRIAADTPVTRPRAIEYSDAYYLRLKLHRIGSIVMIPMVGAQYVVGQKLANGSGENDGLKGVHGALAAGTLGLFGLNTITGAWNLYEARNDPNGRTRRYVHAALMLAADAGFALTAALTPERDRFEGGFGGFGGEGGGTSTGTHRRIAITSGALTAAGALLMLIWRD